MKIEPPKTESQLKREKWKNGPKRGIWKHMSIDDQIVLEELNDKIENLFDKGKRVVVISDKIKGYANYITENIIDAEFEIGDVFLVDECNDLSKGRGYGLKLVGITMSEDEAGFERTFPSGLFCPESSARYVLQGMNVKFDKDNKIIKHV